MKNLNIRFKTDILPHTIAVAIFFLITLLFFNPIYFENKNLDQHDIIQWEGGAKELLDYREATGEEGLWTNSMFGGMPAYLVNTRFSGNLVIYVEKVFTLFLDSPPRIVFSSFLSFYILLICFNIRPGLAIAGALIFGLTSHNIIGIAAGHNARIAAIAYMPLVLAGVHLSFSKKYMWGAVLTMLGMAFNLRVNHFQITYYLMLMVLIYGAIELFYAIKQKRILEFGKTVALLGAAVIIALGCNLGRMWTIMEYTKYSTRGPNELINQETGDTAGEGLPKSYAFQHSNGIFEPLFLFIPNFMGGSSYQSLDLDSHLGQALKNNGLSNAQIRQQLQAVPTYYGDQPGTAPYYAGALAVFLFVLGLFVADKKIKIWISICVILSILLGLGHNFSTFNNFIFDYFPGYNKFRSVTFTIIIAIIGIILLGFHGLEKYLQKEDNKKNTANFFKAFSIVAGIAIIVLFYSFIGNFEGAIDARLTELPDWYIDALRNDRASLVRNDVFRSLLFVALGAAIIYFYKKKKITNLATGALFIVVALLDNGLQSNPFLDDSKFRRNPERDFFKETEADQMIRQDQDLSYRVYALPTGSVYAFSDARTSYYHKSLGGYHGAKIRRYQDLIDHCITEETTALIEDLQQSGGTDMAQFGVLNMLNTKYLVAGTSSNAVLRNPDHNGNAWLVGNVVKVNSPDHELDKLCEIDTKTTAVVDVSKFDLTEDSFNDEGTITLKSYAPNKLMYKSSLNGKSLGVFSEIFYPLGWKATVDGNPVDILRVNYVLRALPLEAGIHEIEFTFEPKSYRLGNQLMLAFSLLLILSLITAMVFTIRNLYTHAT